VDDRRRRAEHERDADLRAGRDLFGRPWLRAGLQAAAAHVVAEGRQLDAFGDGRGRDECARALDAIDAALLLQPFEGLAHGVTVDGGSAWSMLDEIEVRAV